MKKNKLVLVLAFLTFLYIGPALFTSNYTILAEPNMTKDFSISAEWYEEEWHYREIGLLEGGSGIVGDYQVRIYVNYDSNMQADFDDILYTTADGETLLDFWRESYIESTSAIFWVEFTGNLNEEQNFYIYYGNAGVSTASNGTATFPILYEDWSSQSVDPAVWDTTNNDGSISWDAADANHGYTAKIEGGTGTDKQSYASVASGLAPTALMWRSNIEKTLASDQEIRIGATGLGFFGFAIIQTSAGTQTFYVYDDESNQDTQVMADAAFDNWFTWQITRDETDVKLYKDTVLEETASWSPDEVDQIYTSMSVTDSEKDLYLDWICVRKFVTDEPEFASFEDPENNFPPPEWEFVGEAELIFNVPVDETGLNLLLIFLGLCMIPFSTLYLVKGGKSEMSLDKLFFGLIAFVMGWALFLGGIM